MDDLGDHLLADDRRSVLILNKLTVIMFLLRSFNVFYSAASRQDTAAGQTAVAKAQELMSRWGVAPDRVTINTLIDQAIKHGRLEEAIKIFERVLRGVSLA